LSVRITIMSSVPCSRPSFAIATMLANGIVVS
jgi:hypothetical protein